MKKPLKPVEPYKIGDKIKIHLNETEGNFKCTFGKVVAILDPKKPLVKYVNYSDLPIQRFNRFVLPDEITMTTKFRSHLVKPLAQI